MQQLEQQNLRQTYQQQGYLLLPEFFSGSELMHIRPAIEHFHSCWQKDNQDFYRTRAINSAYLTAKTYLNDEQRLSLFQFIGSEKLANAIGCVPVTKAAFINTQLFFNPHDPELPNYWHRDCQYGNDIEAQKATLSGPEALHFRVSLEDEPGIEIVPGSNHTWDTSEELDVRLQLNGRKHSEDLSTGKKLPMKKGDLLIFSANTIHRGLYGMERRAFDILFCEAVPSMMKFLQPEVLPDLAMLEKISCPDAFATSMGFIGNQ